MAAAKKEKKKPIMSCASSGHITKLKQSIFAFRYLCLLYMAPEALTTNLFNDFLKYRCVETAIGIVPVNQFHYNQK
jgi:hypothetical protein